MNKKLKQEHSWNNRGASFITVLVVLSFVAILGVMTLSVALLNSRMRSRNQASDRNFYKVEKAMDEIYAGMGRDAQEHLYKSYQAALNKMPEGIKGDAGARAANTMKEDFTTWLLKDVAGVGIGNFSSGTNVRELAPASRSSASGKLAAYMMKFYKTPSSAEGESADPEALSIVVGNIVLKASDTTSQAGAGAGTNIIYDEILLKDVCFTYKDENRGVQSAVTIDMDFKLPDLHFSDGIQDLLDYALVSNKKITFTKGQPLIDGNVYADTLAIGPSSTVSMISSSVGVYNTTQVDGQSSLKINPAGGTLTNADSGLGTSFMSGDVLVTGASELDAVNTSLLVRNDLKLGKDASDSNDRVVIGGSYVGYGSSSAEQEENETGYSSAIVLNGKNNLLDLSGLTALAIAGRAYIKPGSANSMVYPLGESIAVQASQMAYLVPAEDLVDGSGNDLDSNPMAGSIASVTYKVQVPGYTSDTCTVGAAADPACSIYAVENGGYIYVFRNFKNDSERNDYLKDYLTNAENADTFASLVESQFATTDTFEAGKTPSRLNSTTGVILGNKDWDREKNIISTAGSLVSVNDATTYGSADSASGETGDMDPNNPFDLVRQDSAGKLYANSSAYSEKISWSLMDTHLTESAKTLRATLSGSENALHDDIDLATISDTALSVYPMKNFIDSSKASAAVSKQTENAGRIVVGQNINIALSGSGATIGSETIDTSKNAILVIATGDVKVTGAGTFHGLIASFGNITVESADTTSQPQFIRANKSAFNFDSDKLFADPDNRKIISCIYGYENTKKPVSETIRDYSEWMTQDNWRRESHRITTTE